MACDYCGAAAPTLRVVAPRKRTPLKRLVDWLLP